MKNPIFILGAHKSGTSLLRSLLDGHPELFVIPIETHIFQMASFWVDYRLRSARPPIASIDQTKQAYIQLVSAYNKTTNAVSDADVVDQIDIKTFKNVLDNPSPSFQDLIYQYFNAIYQSLFHQPIPSNLRIVEKSVEQAEFACDLKKLFPDAKFIHILRNPYSNLVALRRAWGRKHYPLLSRLISCLNNSWYNMYRNMRLIDDYKVIRYEDLLISPRPTMEKVAEFLEISFIDEMLLSPTSIGRPWKGNSSRAKVFNKISETNLDLWKGDVTDLEVSIVNRNFKFILDKYNYDELQAKHSIFRPARREYPHIYFLNRVFFLLERYL